MTIPTPEDAGNVKENTGQHPITPVTPDNIDIKSLLSSIPVVTDDDTSSPFASIRELARRKPDELDLPERLEIPSRVAQLAAVVPIIAQIVQEKPKIYAPYSGHDTSATALAKELGGEDADVLHADNEEETIQALQERGYNAVLEDSTMPAESSADDGTYDALYIMNPGYNWNHPRAINGYERRLKPGGFVISNSAILEEESTAFKRLGVSVYDHSTASGNFIDNDRAKGSFDRNAMWIYRYVPISQE